MLGIELSRLSHLELKRLLDVARSRQQEDLAQLLLAELHARQGGFVGMTTPEPIAAAPLQAARQAHRPRRSLGFAVAASAAAVGAALAWGLSTNFDVGGGPEAQPVTLATSVAAPRIAVALTGTETFAAEAAPLAPAAASPEPHPEPSVRTDAKPAARHNPCLDLPTARERLICGYPSIAIQERRLKEAYTRAVAAGADPRAVESTQAAWDAGSAEVMDRKVLNERYDRRVRELEASAAALQPPG